MTSTPDAKEFQSRLQHLDALLKEAQQMSDPNARTRMQQIVSAILDLHEAGMQRLLKHIEGAGNAGVDIVDACVKDPMVSGLLLLHGLHPQDVEERVAQALEEVRPYLRSHGGNVELVDVHDGVVRLRLEGSCHHCSSSAATMEQTIEEAIYGKAPEVVAVEVETSVEEMPRLEPTSARVALPLV